MPTVDLVVIARNSAEVLQRIYGSSSYMAMLQAVFQRLVYVDSSSDDGSVAVMETAGFSCLVLCREGRLSAAAARRSAACYSSADILFFVDGDMILEDPSRLPSWLEAFRQAQSRDPRLCGFTGSTLDCYADGRQRRRTMRPEVDGCAPSFGGFVALERRALMSAGNWNGNVVANEELELHARLRRAGRRVLYLSDVGVQHFTVAVSPLHELAAAYLPLRRDRYGALGLAVRASWRSGAFLSLLRLMPEPFALSAVVIAGSALVFLTGFAGWLMLLSSLLVFSAWVARKRGSKFIVVVPALALSMPWGMMRYRELPVRWRARPLASARVEQAAASPRLE